MNLMSQASINVSLSAWTYKHQAWLSWPTAYLRYPINKTKSMIKTISWMPSKQISSFCSVCWQGIKIIGPSLLLSRSYRKVTTALYLLKVKDDAFTTLRFLPSYINSDYVKHYCAQEPWYHICSVCNLVYRYRWAFILHTMLTELIGNFMCSWR